MAPRSRRQWTRSSDRYAKRDSVFSRLPHNERGPVTILTIGAGEILGWSWLVEPYRWHFDAQARVSTQAIVFDAKLIRNTFERYPEFGYTMMTRFAPIIVRRLQEAGLQLLDLHNYVCG